MNYKLYIKHFQFLRIKKGLKRYVTRVKNVNRRIVDASEEDGSEHHQLLYILRKERNCQDKAIYCVFTYIVNKQFLLV